MALSSSENTPRISGETQESLSDRDSSASDNDLSDSDVGLISRFAVMSE